LAKTIQAVLKRPPLPAANVPAQPEKLSIPTPPIRPSGRKSILIAITIAALVIVGGAGWYLVQKKKGPLEKPALTPTPVPITPAAVTPVTTPALTPIGTSSAVPITSAAVTPIPTLVPIPAQTPSTPPPIANARGPWLFPDSSSRHLSAAELSSLSPDDLWRARNEIFARNGYKFKTARGIAFAHTLGNYYRGVDDNQDRVFNSMNQYEKANVTLIQSIESGR
jgi:YARHG domain